METDPTLPDQEEASQAQDQIPVFDPHDEFSILNLVSDRIKEAILKIPPELLELTEGELRQKCKPTQLEFSLRVSFWSEFEKIFAMANRKKIVTREVYRGICSEGHFFRLLADTTKVAWLVRPMETYEKQIDAIALRMTDKLWAIADMDLVDDKGKISTKRADLFLRVYKEVVARKKGSNVRNVIHDKRKMIMVQPGSQQGPTAIPQVIPNDLKTVRKRIAELDSSRTAPTQTIDITAEPSPVKVDTEVETFE